MPDIENDGKDIQAVFQRAFEARFKPLERERIVKKESGDLLFEDVPQEIESDWDGFSSEEEPVQVVEYSEFTGPRDEDELLKQDVKAFMVTPMLFCRSIHTNKTLYSSLRNHPQAPKKTPLQ